jgi:hypothetical protein
MRPSGSETWEVFKERSGRRVDPRPWKKGMTINRDGRLLRVVDEGTYIWGPYSGMWWFAIERDDGSQTVTCAFVTDKIEKGEGL